MLRTVFHLRETLNVLGVLRILLTALALRHGWPAIDAVFHLETTFPLIEPNWVLRWLPLPAIPSPDAETPFRLVYLLAGTCAVLGLGTRAALLVCSGLLTYLYSVAYGMGFFDHEMSLTTQILFLLVFTPGTTALSLERLIPLLARRRLDRLRRAWIQPVIPAWPVQLLLVLVAITYFSSAYSKVRYTGWRWLDGRTLTFYLDGSASAPESGPRQLLIGADPGIEEDWRDGRGLVAHTYGNYQTSPAIVRLGRWLAARPPLMTTIATSAFLLELLGPVLLLGGWWRNGYLLAAFSMHAAIGVLMGLPFREYQLVCLLLLDWSLLGATVRRWTRSRAVAVRPPAGPAAADPAIVFFDGDCNLCNGWVNFLIERDVSRRFRYAALQSDYARDVLAGHALAPENPRSIVLYEAGRTSFRSEAVLRILGQLGFPYRLASALRLIPRRWRDAAYEAIARRRYAWFGRRETCRLPTPQERALFIE